MGTPRIAFLAITSAVLLGSCESASEEEKFYVDGQPLEMACLSDTEYTRLRCFEYIRGLLNEYEAHRDRRERDPFVGCYYGELLTLRNVGMRGYRQVLAAIEWTKTVDGRAQTSSYPEIVRASHDFYSRIEPARDAIRNARESGLRWSCRLSFVLTRQRFYW